MSHHNTGGGYINTDFARKNLTVFMPSPPTNSIKIIKKEYILAQVMYGIVVTVP